MTEQAWTISDNAIHDDNADLLGRAPLADAVAAAVRTADVTEGAVVAIFGRWGLGKTSLLNMVRRRLGADPHLVVLDFNPWLFSGTEQLIGAFFAEAAAQLRDDEPRFGGLADQLERYGSLLSPLEFLPWVGGALKHVGVISRTAGRWMKDKNAPRSVNQQRLEIEKLLTTLERPLVVVVDDIDRLSPAEIRDVFRLVRLTGRFRNIIYLLAFDRLRVEQALSTDGIDGRAYLEKMVQVGFDVPTVPTAMLRDMLTKSIDRAIEDVEYGPFDEADWPDIEVEVVMPLVTTIRDVKRYVAVVPSTVRALGKHVALVDVLGLEAIRLFLPDTFALLPTCVAALTSSASTTGREAPGEAQWKKSIERLVASGGEHSDIVANACRRMFPATARHLGTHWLSMAHSGNARRARRVADPNVLRYYLDHTRGGAVTSVAVAADIFAALQEGRDPSPLLASVGGDEIEQTITALEDYEGDFDERAARLGVPAVLAVLPHMRTERRGLFDFGPELALTRVAYRMLRGLDSSIVVEIVNDVIAADSITLTAKLELVTLAGHRDDAGERLVTAEQAVDLESALSQRMASTSPTEIAAEREVLRLLFWARTEGHIDPSTIDAAVVDPALATAVIRKAVTANRSQGAGSRAVSVTQVLQWDALVTVMGGDDAVRRARQAISDNDDQELATALELVDRYLSGWRPDRFSR